MWVDPGWFTRALMVSALPALLVSVSIASGLGRLGINQIWSFMISMPLLLSAWCYLLGWPVDRWAFKHIPKQTVIRTG